tara:strand:- start:188 stop:1261 length:1074 start_codon:yes stop_codon:yes gene_type:complete
MKVCILGDNLTSLALAKALVKKEIYVDLFYEKKNNKIDTTRTIGISKSNVDYFNTNISNIKGMLWPIKRIKIFTENSNNKEILKFEDQKDNLFSILRNQKIFDQLILELKKNKFLKFKKKNKLNSLSYSLIINCDIRNEITKKFFSRKFEKKYNSIAFTTIIDHKKLSFNNEAIQIFTDDGPIAFLPISKEKTSIVYSARIKKKKTELEISKIINKFNPKYEIKKIYGISKFELKSMNLREYYKDNILAFGDLLHKLHPLAGQGFNMSIRDIKELLKIINHKIKLGLPIDQSVCVKFQNNMKSKNFVFSEGINFIYEYFNSENKIGNNLIDSTARLIGGNKILNKYFKNIADTGLQN